MTIMRGKKKKKRKKEKEKGKKTKKKRDTKQLNVSADCLERRHESVEEMMERFFDVCYMPSECVCGLV